MGSSDYPTSADLKIPRIFFVDGYYFYYYYYSATSDCNQHWRHDTMPCDSLARERAAQLARERAIEELEKRLREKSARIVGDGVNVSIEGWDGDVRAGFCDECAVNRLRVSDDFEIRHMVEHALGVSHTHRQTVFGHGHTH